MLRKILPNFIGKFFFGNREKYGYAIDESDSEWRDYQNYYKEYHQNYKNTPILNFIDNLGYSILKNYDFSGKVVMEIGVGLMPHIPFMKNMPDSYYAIDVNKNFINYAITKLGKKGKVIELKKRDDFPKIEDGSIDIIISFYTLEHLLNIDEHIEFYKKKLRIGGMLIGAIPNEGGVAWGLGRLLTTYRSMRAKGFNYNKLFCWEHPNTCDTIIKKLNTSGLSKVVLKQNPLPFFPFYDLNLVTSFIFNKNQP